MIEKFLPAWLIVPLLAGTANAGSLTIFPVIVQMAPGQIATSVTIITPLGDAKTAYQVRAFAWSQKDGVDTLVPTDDLMISPPLGTMAAGSIQVVRLVLRARPAMQETTYRILLDEVPPPAVPGTVAIGLRLSMPVFAEPKTRTAARVRWGIKSSGGQTWLVATNAGNRHQSVSDITVAAENGDAYKLANPASPYILAGMTRRWQITGTAPAAGAKLRLRAKSDIGSVDQLVAVNSIP